MLLENQWRLAVYPGGDDDAAEGMVSLYLDNMSDKAIEIYFGFSVNDGNGKQVAHDRSPTPDHFDPQGGDVDHWGFPNFATRVSLLSSLVDGTLVIEVRMRLATPTTSVPPPFIPENPVAKMIQGLFLKNNSADIMLEVGGEEQLKDNAITVAKTAPVTFPAHSLIVANCSSIFAELCESNGDDRTTPIQINDVTPDIFRLLLSYIYGGKISNDDMKSHAREIIDAADRYGVTSLKLEAEASIVEDTTFTVENVIEHLLYAESKNCALLKEAALDYMVENHADVIEKLTTNTLIPGSLIKDIMFATVFRGEKKDGTAVGIESQLTSLRISELRKKAHEKGIDVDGSREMLIAALKESL
jgi:hypothetical protein